MFVTELGMVIEVKLLQLAKAKSPMFVTEFGIVTEVILLQSAKALLIETTVNVLPLYVTLDGIITLPEYVFPVGLVNSAVKSAVEIML